MSVNTTAGAVISLTAPGTLPATQDAAGYNAIASWVACGEVTDLGSIGKTFNTVNHSPLASRRVIKLKGSFNNGTMAVKMGRDFSDAGQTAFQAGLASDLDVAVRVVLQTGKKLYFQAKISSFVYDLGGVDTITAATANMELTQDILEV